MNSDSDIESEPEEVVEYNSGSEFDSAGMVVSLLVVEYEH